VRSSFICATKVAPRTNPPQPKGGEDTRDTQLRHRHTRIRRAGDVRWLSRTYWYRTRVRTPYQVSNTLIVSCYMTVHTVAIFRRSHKVTRLTSIMTRSVPRWRDCCVTTALGQSRSHCHNTSHTDQTRCRGGGPRASLCRRHASWCKPAKNSPGRPPLGACFFAGTDQRSSLRVLR